MTHPPLTVDYATHCRVRLQPLALRLLGAAAAMAAAASAPCAAWALAADASAGAPAARIVSLSPHITEIFFAVGAGAKLIGVDTYSNYPEEARRIERVADVFSIDIERLLALRPDLIVYWKSGTPRRQQEQLKNLGLILYGTEQRSLADIEAALIEFGRLGGTQERARAVAARSHAELQQLRERYAQRVPLRVFYEVWDRPMYTLSGEHVVNEALKLCGATNIFSQLKGLAPVVDVEAVLAGDPDVIIVAASGAEATRQISAWDRFSGLRAARTHRVYAIEPDLLNRMTPRILQGVDMLCQRLDQARLRAGAAAPAARSAAR